MAVELPCFKYHPDPIATGVIKAEPTLCPICGQRRSYVYCGPFYTTETVKGLCPWCISDGSAARKYHGSFQDAAMCESVDKPEYLEELLHRTPGYSGWQQEAWLSHCGDFCAYIAAVDWPRIEPIVDELHDDIERVKKDMRLGDDEFVESLDMGRLYAYLFKCLHCEQHRITFDLD